MRFATGRFYQFISQAVSQQETGYNKNFWVLSDGNIHPVIRSDHYIIGATFEAGNFLFDAEGYYKNYSGIQEYIFVSPFMDKKDFAKYFKPNPDDTISAPFVPVDSGTVRPSYFISGKGYAYGIDFSIRFKKGKYTSWLSYSLNHTMQRFPEINNDDYYPAPTDQLHQLNWANMLSLGKWNFGLNNIFNTGRPYIEYTLDNKNVPTIRQFRRLPNYFRTDLSANYNFRIKSLSLKTGATLINLFNNKNYYDMNSRKFEYQNASFSETNIIRAQGISLNFFIHFAF
jgi:hypothetical protein